MGTSLQLEEIFDFTQEEVELNRQGRLSKRQEEIIRKSLRRTNLLLLVSVCMVSIAIVVLPYAFISALGTLGAAIVTISLILILMSARAGISKFREYLRYQKSWRLASIAVRENMRTIDFKEEITGRHIFYLLDVEEGQIELNEKEFGALKESSSYHIFYLSYEDKPYRVLSIKTVK